MARIENKHVIRGSALSWRGLLFAIVMSALVVSLATRTFHRSVPQGVTAHAGTVQAVRQHMDRDAVRWFPPVLVHTTQQAPVFYPHIAPAGPPIPALLLIDDNLYNRPPPSC